MIKLDKIGKSYGSKPVLQDIDMTIPTGKLTALIGPNGAGKSTLLSIMSRLVKQDRGQFWLKGQEIQAWQPKALAKELTLLRQALHVQSRLTVDELVAFGRFPHSQGRLTPEDKEQIQQAISYMALDDYRQQELDTLSGGQLQRACIAMVLAQDTDIIFLDEPLNNLDIKQGLRMMTTLRRLVDELGKTVVMVIHDINTASQFADQIIAFKNGQIFCAGSPDLVMQKEVLEDLYEIPLTITTINGTAFCSYAKP